MFITQTPVIFCCEVLCKLPPLLANRSKRQLNFSSSYLKKSILFNKNSRGMSNTSCGAFASVSGECKTNTMPSECPLELEPILRLNNIEKSQQDTRDYRGLKMQNGIKVLLVSDTKTDVSAAALAVQVGHMSDPDNLPGLAHFCEHMLFLGTEKYPQENGYTTYLSQSGGSSNAATYPLMTKYHFHVAPDKLDEALDRFSQFFIGPLFIPSATEREIHAVIIENKYAYLLSNVHIS